MTSTRYRKDCRMYKNLWDRYEAENGGHSFTFTELPPPRKIGLGYTFKFGKHKGESLIDVLSKDKGYIKYLLDNDYIQFTKKDNDLIRSML